MVLPHVSKRPRFSRAVQKNAMPVRIWQAGKVFDEIRHTMRRVDYRPSIECGLGNVMGLNPVFRAVDKAKLLPQPINGDARHIRAVTDAVKQNDLPFRNRRRWSSERGVSRNP